MDSDIGATATLVQQQHQTVDGNHYQGQKEQDNVNGTVESAEGHAVDRFRGEAGCSVKEIAVVAPDNDSVGDSSTQCSDVMDDDNEEEETDVEESGAGGWIMNPPVSTIVQQHQAFDTTNGYIALPNSDSSNFGAISVTNSTDVRVGNETIYNAPVTIHVNHVVYTNSSPNQDASKHDASSAFDNTPDLSTSKDNEAPNRCIFPQNTNLNKVIQWLWTWKRAVLSCVITLILLAIVVPITVHFTHQSDASVSPEIPTSSTEGTRPAPAPQSQSPTRTNNTVLPLNGSSGAVARANFDNYDGTPYIVNTVESSQNCTTASTTWIFENGNRRQVCSRQLIFEDNFDNLNATKWNQLNRFAGPPDYEIVVYMTDEVTDTSDGQLRIKPILMLNTKYGTNFVSRGTLKIENCTGKIGTAECYRKAAGFYILPPVISGRINTKGKFEFLFGRVEIRAKLPHGDWVYPVITLESAENTWQLGLHHEIRIASSVGNEELRTPEGEIISGHILAAGGLTVSLNESNAQSNNRMTLPKRQSGKTWSDDFHIFEIEWKSGLIVVKVDGVQYGEQPVDGSFGKPSYLTLGVAVGGLHEFQDHVTSNGYAKPWRNAEAKTFYKFYHAKNHWHPTWDTRTALQVDYVKVWAFSQNCTTASTTWIFENGNRRQACSRQLIFEDNFDNLNATKWNQLNRFAGPPDYEFVVYMTDEVTDTSDGQLRIKPILLNTKYGTNFVLRGTLKIENCTGEIGTVECYQVAAGFYIFPPLISGRINTKGKFEFLFGRVEIRAKLPHGDWVYPVITLESAENTWQLGLHHEIRIASSVGNEELRTPEGETVSGHILAAGGLTASISESNAQSNNRMTLPKRQSGKTWSDDFHIFEIEWKSGLIVVKVDGVQYGEQAVDGSFGKPSYLTLGVAVGGFHEFQDHVTSNGYAKPWRNVEAKASYNFYHAKDHWYPTWDTRTALQVDYVKVWAL